MSLAAIVSFQAFVVFGLLLIGYVFGVPLLIWSTFRQQARPKVDRLDESTRLPMFIRKQFKQAGGELESLGFELADTLYLPEQLANVRVILQLYVNRSAQDSAIIVTVLTLEEETWGLKSQYSEFSTRYQDGTEFNTNNSNDVSAYRTPEETTTTRVPWLEAIGDVYRAHCLILQSNAGTKQKELRLDSKFAGDAIAYLANGMREEMENAVSDGYLKLSPDGQHFTATLKGAYMMTWAQIPPFKYLVVANTKRQSKSRLARAGFAE